MAPSDRIPDSRLPSASRWPPSALLRAAMASYLYMDDSAATDVAFATVVGNLEGGDPLWLLLVNPASTGKTELIQAFRDVPACAWLAEVTENTLLSGLRRQTKSGRSHSAPENSLLFRLTDVRLRRGRPPVRVILIQDFTGLITARREKRDAVLGQLRQVYDGRLVKSTGVGEDLMWEGYLGMLGAVTPKYDVVAELNSILGERFILYRPLRVDVEAEARSALLRSESEGDWRNFVAQIAARLVRRAAENLPSVVIPVPVADQLITLARLTSAGRATVVRDGATRVIRAISDPEGPARLSQQFKKLLRGLCAVRGLTEPGEAELAVVAKTARDTIPSVRLAVMRALYKRGGNKRALADRTRLPPTTIQYLMQDLTAVRVTNSERDGWQLAKEYRILADRSAFFGPGHEV